jgi:5-formyltetrahydrofolate cyclo-ligase
LKKRLREKLLKKRDSISPEEKVLKEKAIEQKLFDIDVFKKAGNLLMYVSFRSEVGTRKYLDDVLEMGKRLILPVVDTRHGILKLYEIKNTSELAPGHMGIPEPSIRENRRYTIKDIELVIIPGTGFDLQGNRLGYGGGYYDKLLSMESKELAGVEQHIPTIALAFEEQIGETIPAEPHDIKVDMIITDARVINCEL